MLAADADRRAIERRLHDGVQQDLVALAVELQLVDQALEARPREARRRLEDAARSLEQALHALALLAERVHPSLLEANGLAAALRIAAGRRRLSVSADLVPAREYPPELVRAVFWCCLDLVERLDEDAQPRIAIRDEDGSLAFEIAGEGRTGSSDELEAALESLRDRVEALSGRVTTETRDGAVEVCGSLPLSRR